MKVNGFPKTPVQVDGEKSLILIPTCSVRSLSVFEITGVSRKSGGGDITGHGRRVKNVRNAAPASANIAIFRTRPIYAGHWKWRSTSNIFLFFLSFRTRSAQIPSFHSLVFGSVDRPVLREGRTRLSNLTVRAVADNYSDL